MKFDRSSRSQVKVRSSESKGEHTKEEEIFTVMHALRGQTKSRSAEFETLNK